MSDRMSPRFIGRAVGMGAKQVYDILIKEGLITYYRNGNVEGYNFTELGESLGGKYSMSGGTPTFPLEKIKHLFE